MRSKELVFALVCALAGAGVAFTVRHLIGSWPSPVISYSMVIIGLGAALVVMRYQRLGPFDGELGSPRLEADLRERIRRETERSLRYGRELTVVAVRQERGPTLNWNTNVRNVDVVIPCRKGLTLILLPETGPEGALVLLRRVSGIADTTVQAALVSCPSDGRTGDELSRQLLQLIRQPLKSGYVAMRGQGADRTLPLSV